MGCRRSLEKTLLCKLPGLSAPRRFYGDGLGVPGDAQPPRYPSSGGLEQAVDGRADYRHGGSSLQPAAYVEPRGGSGIKDPDYGKIRIGTYINECNESKKAGGKFLRSGISCSWISGPCVIEEESIMLKTAEKLKEVSERL